MKVRVGFGLGANAAAGDAEGFAALVDALDQHRFDSLWLSERVGAPSPDPGHRARGRRGSQPAVEARHERAGAAGTQSGAAREVVGVARRAVGWARPSRVRPRHRRAERAGRVRRRALGTGAVVRRGAAAPAPVLDRGHRRSRRSPLPLRGHLGAAEAGAATSRRVARRAGAVGAAARRPARRRLARELLDTRRLRSRPPGHRGRGRGSGSGHRRRALRRDGLLHARRDPRRARRTRSRSATRASIPHDLIHSGVPAVRKACERFVDVGFSKLVLVPFTHPPSWDAEIAELAAEVLPIQT